MSNVGRAPPDDPSDRALAGLRPARRNNYFTGKILTAEWFADEQRYVLSKQWLHNRALHGCGVVFGLAVEVTTTAAGSGLVVGAGMAIDGWGREILVPHAVELVPLRLTDDDGCPLAPPAATPPPHLVLRIGYRVDLVDPSVDGAAGAAIEVFSLVVREGVADDARPLVPDGVVESIRAGDLHRALLELAREAPPDPDDPSQILANVTVEPDGTLVVDDCAPRTIVPTNRLMARLLDGMASLSARGSTAESAGS